MSISRNIFKLLIASLSLRKHQDLSNIFAHMVSIKLKLKTYNTHGIKIFHVLDFGEDLAFEFWLILHIANIATAPAIAVTERGYPHNTL